MTSIDASELILNLVQKVKTEVKKNSPNSFRSNHSNTDNDSDTSSDQHVVVKEDSISDLSAKSCLVCKEKKQTSGKYKFSSNVEEDLKNVRENVSRKRIREDAKHSCDNREKSADEKILVLEQLGRSQINPEGFPAILCIDGGIADSSRVKRKIPRPANAFMLFANEWRKKLAAENPRESNKDISVRLGILWKNMAKDMKEKYFTLARKVDAEHKRKYPDYVYNPKEARLRKAMREQSREFSRRSILQSAIARAGAIAGTVTSGGFLEHPHRYGCVPSPGLPLNPSVESDRGAESWFQQTVRAKPVHSPRMTDWYGNVSDPIERLQVIGAMHQRGLDKCKGMMRNQTSMNVANTVATECTGGFSNGGYSADFNDVKRERELRQQESMDYPEFADGQKWHPYQNGGGHQHARTSHQTQMNNILHPNIHSPGSHGYGPWGQFCHNVLPHTPTLPRTVGVRGPRHTVLLRDRLSGRHCEFSAEASRLSSYNTNKLDLENVRAPYTPPEHQMTRLLEPSIESVIDSSSTSRIRREDDGPRWEPNRIPVENLTPTTESGVVREKDLESRRCTETFETRKKTITKQPLPGFHQAFGSTEIGRFSRSEFFVNMVGESGGSVEVTDTENANVSTDRIADVNGITIGNRDTDDVVKTTATTTVKTFDADDTEETSFEETNNELVPSTSIGIYCGQPNTPRWHSPHVNAVGSEI